VAQKDLQPERSRREATLLILRELTGGARRTAS